jgi:hypothetical protein
MAVSRVVEASPLSGLKTEDSSPKDYSQAAFTLVRAQRDS